MGSRGRGDPGSSPGQAELRRADPLDRRCPRAAVRAARPELQAVSLRHPQRLLDFYDYAAAEGIELYGGGQWELSVGRDQIQLLAALFHPDGPNDVAPRPYNSPVIGDGLPTSPLALSPSASGFGFAPSS